MNNFLRPDWPAPDNVKAYTTLRTAGDLANNENRTQLKEILKLPAEPIWLSQVHGTSALPALPENTGKQADAAFTNQINHICVVMTADCLPILLCNRNGSTVAAIHAGWRGLSNGIIESTIQGLHLVPDEILVWLGPAIGPNQYEVGDEVRECFIKKNPNAAEAFTPSINDRWMADLYALARLRLNEIGIAEIFGGNYCTYSDTERFFSYRRDNKITGRMASLIWIGDSS